MAPPPPESPDVRAGRRRSDDDLLVRSGQGDVEAFGELVTRYEGAVYRYAWRIFRNHHTAEDLAQELFVKLFRNAARYTPAGHFSTYMYRCLTNLCFDSLRRRKRRKATESLQLDPVLSEGTELEPLAADIDLDSGLVRAETKDAVHDALEALPVEVRKAVELREFEGLSLPRDRARPRPLGERGEGPAPPRAQAPRPRARAHARGPPARPRRRTGAPMRRRPIVDPEPYESGIWGTPERPCPSERTLAAHLDGELTEAADAEVDAHLDGCSPCASAHRRLEGLSGLLKGWEARRARVEPPPRLATRVLREIAPESLALRRETVREARRGFVAVAAAACVLVGGFLLGRLPSVPSSDASGVAGSGTLRRADGSGRPARGPRGTGRARRALPGPVPRTGAARRGARAPCATACPPSSRIPPPCRRSRPGRRPSRPRSGPGELACVIEGRTVPLSAVAAFEQISRKYDWYAERSLRAASSSTRDPLAQGTALSDRLPGLDATFMSRVLARARASVPASRAEGGVLLWGLPELVGADGERASSAGSGSAVGRDVRARPRRGGGP